MFKVCVIGLGYVGLPILLNLSKRYKSIGFDLNLRRIKTLKKKIDINFENNLKKISYKKVLFTNDKFFFSKSNLFIVAVPTPTLKNKKPNLEYLKNACLNLSKYLKKNDIIIFESTVFPGITEDICIPILESKNHLKHGNDFFVGYSPERINPGDKKHNLSNISKILAYPYNYKVNELKKLYRLISKKLILTKFIKEAEAAKVIENIQRDVNIALMNEIFLICKKLKLNFENIYSLASTKWNFLKFRPGLVGGHCLPEDPYYLSYISKKNNFNPKIILLGRKVNDFMFFYVKKEIQNIINQKRLHNKKLLICGLTYKPDVADIRNSLAMKIFNNLVKKNIYGYDPLLKQTKNLNKKIYTFKKIPKKFDYYIILTKHKKIINQLQNIKEKVSFLF